MRTLAWIGVVALIVFVIWSVESWKWHECRKVGHGALYCATKVGNSNER